MAGGEDVILEIRCLANKELLHPIVGFQFKDRLGQVIFTDNSFIVYQHRPVVIGQGQELVAKFEFHLPVLPTGDYSITAAIADGSQDNHIQLHWQHDALILRIQANSPCHGLIGVTMKKVELNPVKNGDA
jgi:lipopolysaccharide transport system ATP-binding protein